MLAKGLGMANKQNQLSSVCQALLRELKVCNYLLLNVITILDEDKMESGQSLRVDIGKKRRKKRVLDWRVIDKRQFNIFLYGHLIAILALFFIPQNAVLLLLCGHVITIGFGGSVGYHRLLAHRSFQAPLFVKRTLATFGSLALQGGPLSWSAAHRAHHSKTDQYGDPHSSAKGRWWSHIVWAVYKGPNGFRYKEFDKSVKDLAEDPYLVFLESYALHITILLFIITGIFWGWAEALWLFPLRIVFGWHKNHHESPGNPNFSRQWHQIDLGYWMIKLMMILGLASFRSRKST